MADKGVSLATSDHLSAVGKRVRVTNYSPFRGLEGTIQRAHSIVDDRDDPFCFYLITLEGVSLQEAIWFEHTEVEFIDFLPLPLRNRPAPSEQKDRSLEGE